MNFESFLLAFIFLKLRLLGMQIAPPATVRLGDYWIELLCVMLIALLLRLFGFSCKTGLLRASVVVIILRLMAIFEGLKSLSAAHD